MKFPVLTRIEEDLFVSRDVVVDVLRLDSIHPLLNGNKWFKLKYNLEAAQQALHTTLLTFGGAFSNHLPATAAAGKLFGFKTIGIVRGEELSGDSNKVLRKCSDLGMRLIFITREDYRKKENKEFVSQLRRDLGDFYLIPEGGSNALALKGAAEIPALVKADFDFICCAAGTGGTITGIAQTLAPGKKALGIAVVNSEKYFSKQIRNLAGEIPGSLLLNHDYHLGAYAKTTGELISFATAFEQKNGIKLDLVYNAKLFFGVVDLVKKGFFPPGSRIVCVNTGGFI
jgi:1-aminocyclopropane-1-carboxylate deaminase